MNTFVTKSRVGWEHIPHEAEVGVRAFGTTAVEAFEEGALALTAIVTHAAIEPNVSIQVKCQAPEKFCLPNGSISSFTRWPSERCFFPGIRCALSTIGQREQICRAELRLNRRLAPDIYLDVLPLMDTGHGLTLRDEGTPVDWLVRMRRLDQRLMLDRFIIERKLQRSDLDRLIAVLIGPPPPPSSSQPSHTWRR